ncbi:hypothetical protein [Homoserinimonas hongtaonis]|uniref:hypothetical protein n=1 Tax=Homoserinimonas hongtaonis TaxID=2079791 RepID=UPI000D34D3D1|nr:hypothetical protein [Salinibacterium hongtaonis]AWB89704.1 hypothetical protein C2138_09260 [Salinibacterium hongtaonis]
MHSEADDEALTWDGAEPDNIAARPVEAPSEPSSEAPAAASASAGSSSLLLVFYGILGGVYLLYVVGWIIAVGRDTFSQASLFAEIMYQLGEFLAIASPLIWMGAVFVLTRHKRPLLRVLLLLLGAVVLVPWPFILGGSA